MKSFSVHLSIPNPAIGRSKKCLVYTPGTLDITQPTSPLSASEKVGRSNEKGGAYHNGRERCVNGPVAGALACRSHNRPDLWRTHPFTPDIILCNWIWRH